MHQITVVGAGTMGRSIALAFAMADKTVHLVDTSESALRTAFSQLTTALQGLVDDAAAARILLRLQLSTSLDATTSVADLVLESVPEDLALKQVVWTEIGRVARPDAVLASNTSSFDIATLAGFVTGPERVLGLHWFNPAHLVPCVEIVSTSETSAELVKAMTDMLLGMGKRPAVVSTTPGFVANRIQMAMVAEAFRCLEEGVATAEAIDDIVRYALGFRLVDLGPLAIADLAGLDVYAAIYGYLTDKLGDRFEAPATVVELARAGRYGVKTGAGVYDYPPERAAEVVRERDRAFAQRIHLPARSGHDARP